VGDASVSALGFLASSVACSSGLRLRTSPDISLALVAMVEAVPEVDAPNPTVVVPFLMVSFSSFSALSAFLPSSSASSTYIVKSVNNTLSK